VSGVALSVYLVSGVALSVSC